MAILTTGSPRVWESQTLVARAVLASQALRVTAVQIHSSGFLRFTPGGALFSPSYAQEAGSHQSQLSGSPNRLLEI